MRQTSIRLLVASALTALLTACALPPAHHGDRPGRVVHDHPPRPLYGPSVIYTVPDRHDAHAWRAHEHRAREREAREHQARHAEMLRALEHQARERERYHQQAHAQRERERAQAQHQRWLQEKREHFRRQQDRIGRHHRPRGDERQGEERVLPSQREERRSDRGPQQHR